MLNVEAIVLGKLKLEESSVEINIAIAEAETKARIYCNLPDDVPLPEGINFTLANMAIDILGINKYFAGDETAKAELKSVAMGDTSYSFDVTSKQQSLEKLILNYESDLIKYRRIKK